MCSFNGLLVKLLYREAIFLPSVEQECGKDLQDVTKARHSKSVQVLLCFFFFFLLASK